MGSDPGATIFDQVAELYDRARPGYPDAQEYLDALGTYSGHIALGEPRRSHLMACIRALIEVRINGSITKAYLTQLMVARKRS